MSDVKRYDYGYKDDGCGGARYLGLIEKPDGALVRHSDYAALEAECDTLLAELADANTAYRIRGDVIAEKNAELAALKAPVPAQDEQYPPCDFCGVIPDHHPWHGSGMFRGFDSPHIHACNDCRRLLPSRPAQTEQQPVATVKYGGYTTGNQLAWGRGAGLQFLPEGTALYAAEIPQLRAVAYLDIGAGGYIDLGSDLTNEQLEALPWGRHMLGIIGTYGPEGYVAAAPIAQPVRLPPSPYMPDVDPSSLSDYERGEAQGRCDMWAMVKELNSGAPIPHPADGLVEALNWYAEKVAECRKIGSIGDNARQALDLDGGFRARDALAATTSRPGSDHA